MFEKIKKEIKILRDEVEKELDSLYDWSNFLNSLKGVVEYLGGNRSV